MRGAAAITALVPSSSESKARIGLASIRPRTSPERSSSLARRYAFSSSRYSAREAAVPRLESRSRIPSTPSSRRSSSSRITCSASTSGESEPIASASIWWNWRKRPACGAS